MVSLKFDNVENGWSNFRKGVYEVADAVFGKKVRNGVRNISDNDLCLISRRGLYKDYLSNRSCKNNRSVKKVESINILISA